MIHVSSHKDKYKLSKLLLFFSMLVRLQTFLQNYVFSSIVLHYMNNQYEFIRIEVYAI